jgi:hypothetical protein
MRIMIKGGVWKNTEDEILKVSFAIGDRVGATQGFHLAVT